MTTEKSSLAILKKANKLFRSGDIHKAKELYIKLIGCNEVHQNIVSSNLEIINARLRRVKNPASLSDYALVVHVWHLDVLGELAEAAMNLPDTIDQFVTLPAQFGKFEREQISAAFPRAQQIIVENVGQDVGALFQLMKQVDLGRYSFICKIHTKKGPNMPNEWRRALLDGVLGSKRQVQHIIDRFRADPQVMMAGARQLYLNGPVYLDLNAQGIETIFREIVGDFDFRTQDWGFIAGTCFWIRTSILKRIANCPLDFKPAAYVTDGAPAHAVERMFGLAAALHGGKTLLQDLRFAQRLPDEEMGFPNDLPRKRLRLAQILTPLAVNLFLQPCRLGMKTVATKVRHRVAVFASYSDDGVLPPQVIPYLVGLKLMTSTIVVVFDNDLLPGEKDKLGGLATHVITGRHGEYDFGSYKRGYAYAREAGLLESADDLILCNDSCFGPVGSFKPMFAEMDARGLDFWGATDSHEISYHVQSFFVVLSRPAFKSGAFQKFILGIKKQENAKQVTNKYEIGLTKSLLDAGYAGGGFTENNSAGIHKNDLSYDNITLFPSYSMSRGLPLIKVKSLRDPSINSDGISRSLKYLKEKDPSLYGVIADDLEIQEFLKADEVSFSIIMPSFNRAWCIIGAISAVMAQTHKNFELIIVDDGSNDETESEINNRFKDEVASGKIRYIKLGVNVGVSKARNIGISFARNDWIAYADTDNATRPYFLSIMANTIIGNSDRSFVYGKMINVNAGTLVGRPFKYSDLIRGNFIDLGVLTHKRSMVHAFGGFDEGLRRLVDWDLCIRYTKHQEPSYINKIILDYIDEERGDRISIRESYVKANTQVRRKHSDKPTVSTIILSYNHANFIADAVESALAQVGDFNHEIIISDDGSTDDTPSVINKYLEKYPKIIRNISTGRNVGISKNYRHAFAEAEGQFIAVLEGDDCWTDPEKLIKQATFMKNNKNASMVISRIELFDMQMNSRRLLKRQEGLPSMLSAKHFADNEHLNLIVNLSCCMFRSEIMKNLPEVLYHPRLSEIALAFYHDRLGGIGFLPEVMSTYRMNDKSVWTGASTISKHQQAIDVRECALRVARPVYRATIQQHIDQRRRMLEAERARQSPTVIAD